MKYTVWVQQINGRGTTHVSSHEADSPTQAASDALKQTAHDWNWDEALPILMLRVLGIAKGDIELIEWNDLYE